MSYSLIPSRVALADVPIDNLSNLPFTGLVNQGSTCYLNSVIQVLFHLPSFREYIYSMGHVERDSIIAALRDIFAQLHCRVASVSTTELTNAFGWSNDEAWVQHDVHEMMQKLFDGVETYCKGTEHENFIRNFFHGEITYITRTVDDVSYTAYRNEGFYDVELLLKNKTTIFESLDQWAAPERIEGVSLEIEGKPTSTHTVERSQRFARLPPVLLIHLNRVEFCPETFELVTLRSKWAFEIELDLAPYVFSEKKESNEGESIPMDTQYELRSVIVHFGAANSGHYFAFVRFREEWVCFNDNRVSPVSEEEVIRSSFGSDPNLFGQNSNERATLLLYVRKSAAEEILTEKPAPEHIKAIASEIDATRQREWKERWAKTEYCFACSAVSLVDAMDRVELGTNITRVLSVPSNATLAEVHAAMAAELECPVDRLRVWHFSYGYHNTPQIAKLHRELSYRDCLFAEILPHAIEKPTENEEEEEDVEDMLEENKKKDEEECEQTDHAVNQEELKTKKKREAPFFAPVRLIKDGKLELYGIVHSKGELAELMESENNEEGVKYVLVTAGPPVNEVQLPDVLPGSNLIICPASMSFDQVGFLLQQRTYKKVNVLLLNHCKPSTCVNVGTIEMGSPTPLVELQKEVFELLRNSAPDRTPISPDHLGFHSLDVPDSLEHSLTVFPYRHVFSFAALHKNRVNTANEQYDLRVSILPFSLQSLDLSRVVIFNVGGGNRPIIYLKGKDYRVDEIFDMALQQTQNDFSDMIVENIFAKIQSRALGLRLLQVRKGQCLREFTNFNDILPLEPATYVIDIFSEVKPDEATVNVFFLDRRSGESYFGFPTNIALTKSYEELGIDVQRRVVGKVMLAEDDEAIARWIVAVKGVKGKCRTVGKKDSLRKLVDEVGGELDCILVHRPRTLLLDGIAELNRSTEQSIVIRQTSAQDLTSIASRQGSIRDLTTMDE